MRTTIELPDELFREAKIKAIQRGVTLRELVAEFIELGLRNAAETDARIPKTRRTPLPQFRLPNGTTIAGLSNREIHSLLTDEDAGKEPQRLGDGPP